MRCFKKIELKQALYNSLVWGTGNLYTQITDDMIMFLVKNIRKELPIGLKTVGFIRGCLQKI